MIGSIVALASSLLLARAHPFGDARLDETPQQLQPIMQHASIPNAVRTTLESKCIDCHSIQPRLPFYARLAPISWLVERDIVEGRKAMNLSQWNSYSTDEQDAFREKILLETRSHKMPLPQYRLIHRGSIVTTPEIDAIARWVDDSSTPDPGTLNQEVSIAADAARGKDVFQHRCTGCHSLDQNREGPHLRGVYGREAGSVTGFDYSTALKQSHIHWDEHSLERWLTDPDAFVAGNNMDFHVVKPQERADVIAFLKTMP
ncbi:heme-binding domain-containing protein [Edaphobacter sp. 4G125]|nr:heme-binding domain-containing protein [Edaphobacter sp. 4G125]